MLEWALGAGAAVIPFGGGTSVVGGVEPVVDGRFEGVVTIDLKALDRVLEVDEVSGAARIQAGATGPVLEAQLGEHGLTLRHFPQSFEFSTLGGWIATRAGGHFATLLTHIDDLVESIRALTPVGVWESRRLPGSGAGISPDRMLLGSEGTLGLITEAWVRVRPRPDRRASTAVRFADFAAGAEAVRAIAQSGLYPANCRLIDPDEAAVTGAGDGTHALLVLGFESAHHDVEPAMSLALDVCAEHGGTWERRGAGEGARAGSVGGWRDAFLRAPYLRDTFVAIGVLSETFETAITWDRFAAFDEAVREPGDGGAARCLRRRDGDPALHPRLPGRPGAVLHGPGAGAARRGARAVGSDQAGRRRRGDRTGRHDHSPPRRRTRSPAVVRPPASGAVCRRDPRRQGRRRPRRRAQPGCADRPVRPCVTRRAAWQKLHGQR